RGAAFLPFQPAEIFRYLVFQLICFHNPRLLTIKVPSFGKNIGNISIIPHSPMDLSGNSLNYRENAPRA
ncbi:MAG: hypothetical protein Q4D50_11880, partial [Eubacteriales bacterium]|nr:hypothetical protein [Eubacteriales bacterium]